MTMPPAPPPPSREADVQATILAVAPLHGVILRRQNTGAMRNASGRLVRYGERGAPDLAGHAGESWGPLAGKIIAVEVKRPDWKPPRRPKPGAKTSDRRAHWERQLARLREINMHHGFAWWSDDPDHAVDVLRLLRTGGYRVGFDEVEETVLIPLEGRRDGHARFPAKGVQPEIGGLGVGG